MRAVERANIPPGARLVAAVSGGPDSVALLHTLVALGDRRNWNLLVGHVHHGLRGQEADEDETFVRQLAGELGLECAVAHVDTRRHAAELGLSLEEAARELRYATLSSWLDELKGFRIVTGHTLDDQVETFLLRLMRGSGPRGLRAMSLDTGSIVRPFLSVSRATVMRFLTEGGLAFRVDSSNLDVRLRRNAVRQSVIPSVMAVAPKAPQHIADAAELLRVDDEFLTLEARRVLRRLSVSGQPGRRQGMPLRAMAGTEGRPASGCPAGGVRDRTVLRAPLAALHPALRRATIRELLDELLPRRLRDLELQHIEAIEDCVVRGVSSEGRLPRGLAVTVEGGLVRFVVASSQASASPEFSPAAVGLSLPGEVDFGGFRVLAEILEADGSLERLLAVCGPWHALLDADRRDGEVTVRPWRHGDRIRPIGMEGSRKLQDLFVDRKVPRSLRHLLPVLDLGGELVWVPGMVVDRGFVASGATKRVAHLFVKPPADLHGTI